VAPAELESLLLTHPAVGDCAVIQVPCDASGELPRAYVVLKPQEEPASVAVTETDIYQFVKERVAAYKRLDGGVVFCDSIPKSASGKILRRLLRDRARAERSD
jgi:acyl-coenzyme A synthetase/AMP-(fatty) acid ligase